MPATILEVKGPVIYLVETDDKEVWKRHLDQLKEFEQKRRSTEFENNDTEFPSIPSCQDSPQPEDSTDTPDAQPELNTGEDSSSLSVEPQASSTTTSRYPTRDRHAPNRFM